MRFTLFAVKALTACWISADLPDPFGPTTNVTLPDRSSNCNGSSAVLGMFKSISTYKITYINQTHGAVGWMLFEQLYHPSIGWTDLRVVHRLSRFVLRGLAGCAYARWATSVGMEIGMLTREELQTAQDFLAAAENEFALGNLEAGSERIGDAATAAVRAVAKRRGWSCESGDDLHEAARRLDAESGDGMSIQMGLRAARAGADRARHGWMLPEDAWADMISVRHFIGLLQQFPD